MLSYWLGFPPANCSGCSCPWDGAHHSMQAPAWTQDQQRDSATDSLMQVQGGSPPDLHAAPTGAATGQNVGAKTAESRPQPSAAKADVSFPSFFPAFLRNSFVASILVQLSQVMAWVSSCEGTALRASFQPLSRLDCQPRLQLQGLCRCSWDPRVGHSTYSTSSVLPGLVKCRGLTMRFGSTAKVLAKCMLKY